MPRRPAQCRAWPPLVLLCLLLFAEDPWAAADPPPLDVDCIATRRDGRPVAEAERRAIHYYIVSGQLYVGVYERPLDPRSKETTANRGWPVGMSTDEAIGASGFQMLLGISVSADLVVIYRRGEFRHVVLQESRSGGGTRIIVETGSCRPHAGP
jgi:hypothetical protein